MSPPPPELPPQVRTADRTDCPVTRVLARLGDTWSPTLLRLLADRPHGFNELDRAVEGLSRRMLTRTLRALEDDGLVRRTPVPGAHQATPARVEYALTDRGRALREHLRALGLWAAAADD